MTINGEMKIKTLANFWIFEVKPPIMQAIEIVPDDKLEWAPAADMITLGNIFMHISEASSYWIEGIIDHSSFIDLTPCPSAPKNEIVTLLEDHWKRLENFFARSPEVMEKTYDLQRGDRVNKLTGYWIMLHLFEHDIHHRSQINQYLRVLGIKPPQI